MSALGLCNSSENRLCLPAQANPNWQALHGKDIQETHSDCKEKMHQWLLFASAVSTRKVTTSWGSSSKAATEVLGLPESGRCLGSAREPPYLGCLVNKLPWMDFGTVPL